MRRLLLLVPVLLAVLAGALLLGIRREAREGEPVERADGAGVDAPPPRLVGHGAEDDATSSTAQEVEAPRADGPPRLERPVLRWLEDALPEGVVAGRVVTAAGEPLTGARVELVDLTTSARRRATPDADGRFRVEGLEGALRVVVSADGWATSQWVALPGQRSVEIVLVPEAPVDGIVVDARSGRVVSGIGVDALAADESDAAWGITATTDEDGRFVLRGLAKGSYHVTVARRGTPSYEDSEPPYAPRTAAHVEAGTSDLRVEVEPAADIAGTVRVEGRASPGVVVRIQVMPRSHAGDRLFGLGFTVYAARDGTFRVPRLAPGAYDLEFEAPTDDEVGLRVLEAVVPGTTDLDVVLPAGVVLRGRLVDEAGAGVSERGFLHVVPQGSAAGAPGSVVADIDPGGTFAARGLSRDLLYDLLAVGFDGFRRGRLPGVLPGDEPVEMRLRRGGEIAGRVLDAQGRPPPLPVPVSARAADPAAGTGDDGRWDRTMTQADGSFLLDGLGDHPFLVAAGGGDTPWVSAAVAREVPVGTTDLVLRVERGVAFSGRLVDPAGNPLETPHLQVRPRPGRPGATQATTVGSDGRFAFDGVAPGTVEIYLRLGDEDYVLGPFEAPAKDVEVVVTR